MGLFLTGVRAQYNFADAQHYLAHLDTELEDNEVAVRLLAENGYEDLTDAAYLLSTALPCRISVAMTPAASAQQISTSLDDLVSTMRTSEPTDLASLPSQETWLRCRSVKSWSSWKEVLTDHRTFAAQWPRIFGAYLGPNMLDAVTIESVMLAVNSINLCPFCTGLHGELGRVAGLQAS